MTRLALILALIAAFSASARADNPPPARLPLVGAAAVLPADAKPWGGFVVRPGPLGKGMEGKLAPLARNPEPGLRVPGIPAGPNELVADSAPAVGSFFADDRSPACLFIISPPRDSGKTWMPVELWRDGNSLKLVIDDWDDSIARKQNLVQCYGYVLSLGTLPKGSYTLSVRQRHFMLDEKAGGYRLTELREAGSSFEVHEVGYVQPTSRPLDVGGITDAMFRGAEPTAGAKDRLWQQPSCAVRHGAARAEGEGRLFVGTFDADPWLKQTLLDAKVAAPEFRAPAGRDPLYALVEGPTLDSGQWMSLREVIWQDATHVTLRVELWTDSFDRTKNIPFVPQLLVPLAPPGERAGNYTVTLEWVPLVAERIDIAAYVPRPARAAVETKLTIK